MKSLLPGFGSDKGAPMRQVVKGPPSFGGKMEISRCRKAFSVKYYLALDNLSEPMR